jgi:hypothetical protein
MASFEFRIQILAVRTSPCPNHNAIERESTNLATRWFKNFNIQEARRTKIAQGGTIRDNPAALYAIPWI